MKSKNKQTNKQQHTRKLSKIEEAKETGQLNEIGCLQLDPETKKDPSGKKLVILKYNLHFS